MNRSLIALAVLGTMLVASASANAAADYFLKIDGVKGGSVDAMHKDYIDVYSFNWGVSAVSNVGTGGPGGASRASFSDFSWVQGVDTSVPTLFTDIASGKVLPTAEFDVVKPGARPFTFLSMLFSNVQLTSLDMSGSSGSDPFVSGSFAYSKIEIDVTTQNANGSPGQTYKGVWDLQANRAAFTGSPVVFLQLANMNTPLLESVINPVPEPETYAMMMVGLGLVGFAARRRKTC